MEIYLIFQVNILKAEPNDPKECFICAFRSYDDAIAKARRLSVRVADTSLKIVKRYDATLSSLCPFASVCVNNDGDAIRFEVRKDYLL